MRCALILLAVLSSLLSAAFSSVAAFSFESSAAITGLNEASCAFQHGAALYVGSNTDPAHVAKLSVSGATAAFVQSLTSPAPFIIGATLWLNAADGNKAYGLFSTVASSTAPRVVKLDLATMAFAAQSFQGASGSSMYASAIAPSSPQKLLVATFTFPGTVIEIDPVTMAATGRAMTGANGENLFRALIIVSETSHHALVACATSGGAGIVVKFDYSTMLRIGAASGASDLESSFVSLALVPSSLKVFAVSLGGTRLVSFDVSGGAAPTRLAAVSGSTTVAAGHWIAGVYSSQISAIVVASSEASPAKLFRASTLSDPMVIDSGVAAPSAADGASLSALILSADGSRVYGVTAQTPSRVVIFLVGNTPSPATSSAPAQTTTPVPPLSGVGPTPAPSTAGGSGGSGGTGAKVSGADYVSSSFVMLCLALLVATMRVL